MKIRNSKHEARNKSKTQNKRITTKKINTMHDAGFMKHDANGLTGHTGKPANL
jgi:hypothetical protein